MITTRKVAIYVRVSTTNQAEEGYSIQGQLDSLTKYCEAMDWTIADTYTDAGFSGGKLDRPAMTRLIADAKSQRFDTILVYKLDRLSRSVRDTLYLVKEVFTQNDVHFVSLQENLDTSSAMGNLFLTLLSAIAEFEREQIKERTQLGRLGRAKAGKTMMWGSAAYGYTYDKATSSLLIDPAEALVVKSMFQNYLDGLSLNKIKAQLNEQNIRTRNGQWTVTSVRNLLTNPVYMGQVRYSGDVYPGLHEPIVDTQTFTKVQAELKVRQAQAADLFNPRPFQAKYMLSGLAKCGYCGTPLSIVLGPKRKDGSRLQKYQCRNRFPGKSGNASTYNNDQKCDSGFYRLDDLEAYVINQLQSLQSEPELIDQLFSDQGPTIDRKSLQKQIDSLSAKIERLNDLYIDDRISLDDLKRKSDQFQQQRQRLEQELANDPNQWQNERKQRMREILASKDITTLDYEAQKTMARSLIDTVQVKSDTIAIQWKL